MSAKQERRPRTPIEHTCESPWHGCECYVRRKAEQQRWHRDRNPQSVKAMNLWRLYKVRLEEYEAMRIEQDYRCAICGKHEDEIPQSKAGRPRKDGSPCTPAMKLVVDHCHRGGQVRQLLCQRCNILLAGADDNVAVLQSAVEYLSRHAGEVAVPSAEVAVDGFAN